jgi:hypothetical protein
MITERAKTGFDQLLQAALKSGLTRGNGTCTIAPVDTLDKIKQKKIVVLTVSSYLFRLLAILYFRDDAATRAFFAGTSAEAAVDAAEGGDAAVAATLSEQEFLDRIGECGNMLCGSLNRDLGRHFPHVGKSTPNIIDRDCMRYVDLLGCGLKRHYRISLPDDLVMHASLCVSDYGTVDFHVAPAAEAAEDVSTGELEFF